MLRRTCFLLLLATCAALSRAQQTPDLRKEKLAALAIVEKEMAGLPTLGEHDIGEVIRFTVDRGKIEPVTALALHSPDVSRLTLKGMPGLAKISLITTHAQNAEGRHTFLQFFYRDFSDPSNVVVYTEVQGNPDAVHVSQWCGLPGDGERSVQLMQAEAEGPQSLSVYIQISAINVPPVRIHLLAPSLQELAQTNPAETDQFIRPVFRTLRQEQTVFQVDPKTAYQVLADRCPPNPSVAAAADAAIADMAADAYAQREAAMLRLRDLGEPAALYLLRAPPKNLGAEQSMRVDMFLAPYRPLTDKLAKKLATSPDFLLDCLFTPDPVVRKLALRQLSTVCGKPVDLDVSLQDQPLADAVTPLRSRLVQAPK